MSVGSLTSDELEIISNETLENLRIKIWNLEEKLSYYGFQRERGIETYSRRELQKILTLLPPSRRKEALNIISNLIDIQETLYQTLYALAGATEIVKSVDTDTPEIRLQKLREWIDNYKSGSKSLKKRPKENMKSFSVWVKKTLYLCIKAKNDPNIVDNIEEILKKAYKRKYDQFRVLLAIVDICKEFNQDIPMLSVDMSLNEAIKYCVVAVSKVPENSLLREVKRRYKS